MTFVASRSRINPLSFSRKGTMTAREEEGESGSVCLRPCKSANRALVPFNEEKRKEKKGRRRKESEDDEGREIC